MTDFSVAFYCPDNASATSPDTEDFEIVPDVVRLVANERMSIASDCLEPVQTSTGAPPSSIPANVWDADIEPAGIAGVSEGERASPFGGSSQAKARPTAGPLVDAAADVPGGAVEKASELADIEASQEKMGVSLKSFFFGSNTKPVPDTSAPAVVEPIPVVVDNVIVKQAMPSEKEGSAAEEEAMLAGAAMVETEEFGPEALGFEKTAGDHVVAAVAKDVPNIDDSLVKNALGVVCSGVEDALSVSVPVGPIEMPAEEPRPAVAVDASGFKPAGPVAIEYEAARGDKERLGDAVAESSNVPPEAAADAPVTALIDGAAVADTDRAVEVSVCCRGGVGSD